MTAKRKRQPEKSEEEKNAEKVWRLKRQIDRLEDRPPKDLRSKQTFLNVASWGKKK
jgi:hypothetical protein